MQFRDDHQEVTTWDLQTGGWISTIPPTSYIRSRCFSSTYSIDGKMVAVAYKDKEYGGTSISTYNLLSGTHTYSHHVLNSEGHIVASIWTHGECLRFVTVNPRTITVWQVGFTSMHTLMKVESFPTPDNAGHLDYALFLPIRYLFIFPLLGIWDVQDSKLLQKIRINGNQDMSFSSDGHFFIHEDRYGGIHLWEESPPSYVLHGTLRSGVRRYSRPLLSPNGKSITTSTGDKTQLWHTADPIASHSSVSTRRIKPTNFLLDFSPDGSLAVAARREDSMATVLDLKSGNPRLIIDTGMAIYGLWVTGNTITVFDGERIVTWELSVGDEVLNPRATISDSVWTITLGHPAPPSGHEHITVISHDFNYIVTLWQDDGVHNLSIYDMPTGNHLIGTTAEYAQMLWITPNGCEVGFLTWEGHMGGWKIVKDGKSNNVIGLEHFPENTHLPGRYPWESSHGYNITDDGWIFNSGEKRVIWLPHHWRKLNKPDQRWDGQFLGLLNWELPEPIIVELGE